MPSVSLTLQDVQQSVARPTIFNILDQIKDITKLPKDLQIQFSGDAGFVQTAGTSIDETQRDPKFGSDRYLFVEVSEYYDIASIQEVRPHSFDHLPIFEDRALPLSLRPIYVTSEVNIQLRYRSTSEVECRRWLSDMFLKTSRGRMLNLHDTQYTYTLPHSFISLIEHIWQLRENVAGVGESFQNYFTRCASDRLTIQSNRAGEKRTLAVTEKQARIQGFFDFQGVPDKPQKDRETGTWEVSFSYKFNYQRPEAVYLHYPVSVHNQFLHEKYQQTKLKPLDPFYRTTYNSNSYEWLSLFENDSPYRIQRILDTSICIPEFDDFIPTNPSPAYGTVATILIFLDEGRQTLLNLNDLGDYLIDQDVMAYLVGEIPYMTQMFRSLFFIHLYEGDKALSDTVLEILPDMTVRAKEPLDYRKVYHLRIGLCVETNMVHKEALKRLIKLPKAFVKVLSATNELLRITPGFRGLGNRPQITAKELWPVQELIFGNFPGAHFGPGSPYYPWPPMGDKWIDEYVALFNITREDLIKYLRNHWRYMKTVQTSFIIARPMKDAET